MTVKHTLGPLTIEYDNYGNGSYSEWFNILASNKTIAQVGRCSKMTEEENANAEFIVKAWNSHYELLEACKIARILIESLPKQIINNCVYNFLVKAINKAEGKEVIP